MLHRVTGFRVRVWGVSMGRAKHVVILGFVALCWVISNVFVLEYVFVGDLLSQARVVASFYILCLGKIPLPCVACVEC